MEFANSSLLDEASAAGECVLMAWRLHKKKRNTVIVSEDLFESSKEVIQTFSGQLGIKIIFSEEIS